MSGVERMKKGRVTCRWVISFQVGSRSRLNIKVRTRANDDGATPGYHDIKYVPIEWNAEGEHGREI